MNIIHFHPDFNMANRFVKPLLSIEKKNRMRTKLVIAGGPRSRHDYLTLKFKLDIKNIFLLPIRLYQIYIFLKNNNTELLISHNSTSSLLPLLAGKLLGIKNRIYFNHGVPYVAYKGILRWVLYFLEYSNFKLCSEIITVSKDMKTLLKFFGEKKISVINNGSACGINLNKFTNSKTDLFLRNKLKLKKDDFTVLYVGRPVKRKGFNFTILLWEKYFKKNNFKLLLCGCDNENVKSLLNHLPKNIISLGFVEEIEKIYKLSDVLILPSAHEGFPYSILEAMASRCVVIGNNVVGIKSIIKNNVNGFLINKNNFKSYAKRINEVYKKKELAKKITENAFTDVKKFSRDEFLSKYIIFIKTIKNS